MAIDAVQPNSTGSRRVSFEEEAEAAITTRAQPEATTIVSESGQLSQEQRQKVNVETRGEKDRKLLSLLRGKEERAVREHWEYALDRADMAARGIGEQGHC